MLSDEVVVITGASSGIGAATALKLATRGTRLCLLARSPARLAQVQEKATALGAKEALALNDHKFRLRRLVIQPGGVVAWHSHEERPAIIYIVSGTIVEYASTCAVPIVHTTGDVARETHTTQHWWKNTTRKPVVLLSTDILHDKMDQHGM